MVGTYFILLTTVLLQSSARENDFYYVMDNGLGSRNHIAPNHGMSRAPLVTFNDLFRKFMNKEEDRVRIQLYYESLCPDCRGFDSTQFKETVLTLGPHLNVNVYPYGNAQTVQRNGHIEFICQHGPVECYGNKLHACAIDYLKNTTAAVCYNSCMMDQTQAGKGSDDAAADVCGNSMGINSDPIKQCAKGDRGTQLLQYYGVESMKAHFSYVPYILINGVENSGEHFMKDVCKAFKRPPAACNGFLLL